MARCRCGRESAKTPGGLPLTCARCKKILCTWHYALALGIGQTSGSIVTAPACFPDCHSSFKGAEYDPEARA